MELGSYRKIDSCPIKLQQKYDTNVRYLVSRHFFYFTRLTRAENICRKTKTDNNECAASAEVKNCFSRSIITERWNWNKIKNNKRTEIEVLTMYREEKLIVKDRWAGWWARLWRSDQTPWGQLNAFGTLHFTDIYNVPPSPPFLSFAILCRYHSHSTAVQSFAIVLAFACPPGCKLRLLPYIQSTYTIYTYGWVHLCIYT